MTFPEYSRVGIPDEEEDCFEDDEEIPSSNRPPTIQLKKKKKKRKQTTKASPKKKTSIICGWTFWLVLFVVFALGGLGFVLWKSDASHDFLAKLSLGDVDADQERDSSYNQEMHKIAQDDSSDYASISSDSNDEVEEEEKQDESEAATQDENQETNDANNVSETNDADEEEEKTAGNDEDEESDSAAENEEDMDEDGDTDEVGGEGEEVLSAAEDANLDEDSSNNGEAAINVGYDAEQMMEEENMSNLQALLKPKELYYEKSEVSDLRKHQFLHLHQMKTGGTSVDNYLQCAMNRLRKEQNLTISYGNIHECSELRYSRCRDDKDPICKERLVNASIMSYCAPLKDLGLFNWSTPEDDIRAVTVLRHPVDRVWSMYRFQTKSCYSCMNLTDIYDLLDHKRTGTFRQICMKQLLNHETANMLSHSDLLPKENAKYQEEPMASSLVQEAVTNMKSFFTAIGLTEELNRTIDLFGKVFPWFQSEVEWSDTTCGLTHDNASPQNNRCGPNNTHWELPDHPDEETRKLIEEHNQLDIAVYEAAVEHFWKQADALYMGGRR